MCANIKINNLSQVGNFSLQKVLDKVNINIVDARQITVFQYQGDGGLLPYVAQYLKSIPHVSYAYIRDNVLTFKVWPMTHKRKGARYDLR